MSQRGAPDLFPAPPNTLLSRKKNITNIFAGPVKQVGNPTSGYRLYRPTNARHCAFFAYVLSRAHTCKSRASPTRPALPVAFSYPLKSQLHCSTKLSVIAAVSQSLGTAGRIVGVGKQNPFFPIKQGEDIEGGTMQYAHLFRTLMAAEILTLILPAVMPIKGMQYGDPLLMSS